MAPKAKRVPEFASEEEEREFWDTTSLDELEEGDVEEVEIDRPRRPLSSTFAIRLDTETVAEIRRLAESRGLGATQLVRSWVLEALQRDKHEGSALAVLAMSSVTALRELEALPERVRTRLREIGEELNEWLSGFDRPTGSSKSRSR